jgi:hypothetical protein
VLNKNGHEEPVGIGGWPPISTWIIQAIDAPAQQEVNMVSYFPFKYFDDALFYDLESE